MRRLARSSLTPRESAWLERQTQAIVAKPQEQRQAESNRLWTSAKKNQQRNPLQAILERLQAMASGRQRCMYCEDSEGSAIEHFWPRALSPERSFLWENLFYACTHCNSNEKRTQFPLDSAGQSLLIDPTAEDPLEHLLLDPRTGKFTARQDQTTQTLSLKGEKSIETFGLDRNTLESGRHDAWVALQALIIQYDTSVGEGNTGFAAQIQQVICGYPFSGVFVYLLRTASEDPAVIETACIAALRRRPEIADWPHQSP